MPEKRHEDLADLADLAVIGVDIGKDTFHLGADLAALGVDPLFVRLLRACGF